MNSQHSDFAKLLNLGYAEIFMHACVYKILNYVTNLRAMQAIINSNKGCNPRNYDGNQGDGVC